MALLSYGNGWWLAEETMVCLGIMDLTRNLSRLDSNDQDQFDARSFLD